MPSKKRKQQPKLARIYKPDGTFCYRPIMQAADINARIWDAIAQKTSGVEVFMSTSPSQLPKPNVVPK